MSSNEKEISTKAQMQSEGKADSAFSLKGIMDGVKSKQSEVSDFSNMSKKYRPTAIENNAGFKLRPENAMIMNGTIKVVDGTNALLPDGFTTPTKAGKGA